MNNTISPVFYTPDYNHLSATLVELYQQGVAEVCAPVMENREIENYWDEDKNPLTSAVPVAAFPCRTNPFDATMVAYSRSSSKLTILFSLPKPLLVVAELYDNYGRFIKRILHKQIGMGLTELVCLGSRQRKKPFMVLLSSPEGLRSFRMKVN